VASRGAGREVEDAQQRGDTSGGVKEPAAIHPRASSRIVGERERGPNDVSIVLRWRMRYELTVRGRPNRQRQTRHGRR
jgi:hypothetical protein